MTTNFPTSLDALTNPTSGNTLASPDHAGQHADANDAIEALEAKVGVNGSAVTTSLDYKITNINASNLASGTVPTARVAGGYTGITSVGTLGSLTVTGDVTVDTNTLKVDSTNNRVGIANASPAYTLDVNGTVEATQFLQGTDYLSPYQGFRNKIINGGFDIWQRGTTSSAPANTAYTADRWASIWGTAQRTYSREAGFSNFQYCLRLARNTGSTNTANSGLVQAFETADCYQFQGKTVTLSFYARRGSAWTAASSQLAVTAFTGTGIDQSVATWYTPGWTGQANPLNSTATLTTTAQRFTYTFTVASNATQLIIYLNSAYVGTATANDYWEITGAQLEIGSVATPFEQRPIGTELALCQRYYYRAKATDLFSWFALGFADSTTNASFLMPFAVTMRVKPHTLDNAAALRMTDLNSAFTIFVLSMSVDRSHAQQVALNCTASGLTQFRPLTLEANNSATSYIGFSAEL